MKKKKIIFSSLALLAVAVFVITCYTNPLTGRKSMNFLSTGEENQLGLQSFNQLKQETPVSTDPAQTELVRRVGERISAVANLKGASWEFVTFKDDNTPNAFCMPGGKVGIYTGILPITKDEAGLATVMSHEVGHALGRHGGERVSEQMVISGLGTGLQLALQNKPQQTQQIALTAFGVGSTLAVALPHSRKQELEADYMGLLMMAKAGYDPREAVNFWKRFKAYNDARGGGGTPEFLSTHPLDEKRIKALEDKMPEALKIYENRGK